MATEAVRVCQLQSLYLDIDCDDSLYDDDFNEWDSSNPDFTAFVQAFASNTTLTDVFLSYEILENIQTIGAEKIRFYNMRNKEFQRITSSLILDGMDRNDQPSKDETCHVDDDDDHLSVFSDSSVDSVRTLPLGLWPQILEAAHKQFPNLSMLHHLLTSQTVSLVLLGREERDAWELCTSTTNEDVQNYCRNSKRGYSQISE
jgi:hypothetical protein